MTHAEQFNFENRSELVQSKNLSSAQIYANLIRKFLPDLHSCMAYGQKVIFGTKNDYLGKFDQILRHAVHVSLLVCFLFTVKMTLKLSDK